MKFFELEPLRVLDFQVKPSFFEPRALARPITKKNTTIDVSSHQSVCERVQTPDSQGLEGEQHGLEGEQHARPLTREKQNETLLNRKQ